MRGYRVFNNVHKVQTVWRILFLRFGPVSQVAVLLTMASSIVLLRIIPGATGLVVTGLVFLTGFTVIAFFSTLLAWLDPTDTLGERTALRLLVGGVRHRHVANFDLPGL